MLARLYTFSPGTTIQSAQMNAELDQLVKLVSGQKLEPALFKSSSTSDPSVAVDNTGGGVVMEWRVGGTAKAKVNVTGQIESLLATGTAPFVVASTTKVTNLNADLLDGKDIAELLLSTAPAVKESSGSSRLDLEQSAGHLRFVSDATGLTVSNVTTTLPLLSINKSTRVVTVYGAIDGVAASAGTHLTQKTYVDSLAATTQAAAAVDAQTVPAGVLTGGTDGRIVRLSGSGTVIDAVHSANASALETLFFKSGGKYYKPGSVITGLTGFGAAANYWLGSAATSQATQFSTTAVEPDNSHTQVYLGQALSSTVFYFNPGRPIGG